MKTVMKIVWNVANVLSVHHTKIRLCGQERKRVTTENDERYLWMNFWKMYFATFVWYSIGKIDECQDKQSTPDYNSRYLTPAEADNLIFHWGIQFLILRNIVKSILQNNINQEEFNVCSSLISDKETRERFWYQEQRLHLYYHKQNE